MDRRTGKPLSGNAHLAQSVADILTTPIGSRVGRRDYGSLVPQLIDQPDNAGTRLRLFAACVAALLRWEPRLTATRLRLERDASRRPTLIIEGVDRTAPATNSLARLTVPLVAGAVAI